MPAFIQPSDIVEIAPTAAPGSPPPDPRFAEVIDVLGERVDNLSGQFLSSGYTGIHNIQPSDYGYSGNRCVIAVPRMLSVDSVEQYSGGSWTALDTDRYETGLHFRQKWGTGIDTIWMSAASRFSQLRVRGQVGWGHGPMGSEFDDDPIPKRIVFEFKKQARYEAARAGIGGKSGREQYSGELVVEMDTWLYLQSAFHTFKELQDPRRLFG